MFRRSASRARAAEAEGWVQLEPDYLSADPDVQPHRAPLFPEVWRAALRALVARLSGLSLLVLSGSLGAALWSYDPFDPSLNNVNNQAVQNWLGLPGAYIADWVWQLVGIAGFLIAGVLLVWGLRLLFLGLLRRPLLRLGMLLLSLMLLSLVTVLVGWSSPLDPARSAGGSLGLALSRLVPGSQALWIVVALPLLFLSLHSALGLRLGFWRRLSGFLAQAVRLGLGQAPSDSASAASATSLTTPLTTADSVPAFLQTPLYPGQPPQANFTPNPEAAGSTIQVPHQAPHPAQTSDSVPLSPTAPGSSAAAFPQPEDGVMAGAVGVPLPDPAPPHYPEEALSASVAAYPAAPNSASVQRPNPGLAWDRAAHLTSEPDAGLNPSLGTPQAQPEAYPQVQPEVYPEAPRSRYLDAAPPPPAPAAPPIRGLQPGASLQPDPLGPMPPAPSWDPAQSPLADAPESAVEGAMVGPSLTSALPDELPAYGEVDFMGRPYGLASLSVDQLDVGGAWAQPLPEAPPPRRSSRPEALQASVEPPLRSNAAPVQRPASATAVPPKEAAPKAVHSEAASTAVYRPPALDLLYAPTAQDRGEAMSEADAQRQAQRLEAVLLDYGIKGTIVRVMPGPVVTLYELEPAPGTKTSRVVGLADDIARSMAALSARIAVVPGKSVIGIELPNTSRETVYLNELLAQPSYQQSSAALPLALGKDIGGQPVTVDLAKMPHLLVAGTTGSGKSVAVNTMILSLIYQLGPEQLRFVMIDPKILELSIYDGIPHLLAPVVTEPKRAVVALKWLVAEMNQRYQSMANLNVRNIAGYNKRLKDAIRKGEVLSRKVQTGFDPDSGAPRFESRPLDMQPLPHIVVIVDEMAELMLMVGKEIEAAIQSIAQKARAAGIHLIMATQRPSVDVVTGTIKANFPSRISFAVSSKVDSRTILGEMGAEQLLGMGDLLYMPNGGKLQRVHGPFASDEEVEAVVSYLKTLGEPDYAEALSNAIESGELESSSGAGGDGDLPLLNLGNDAQDDLYQQAISVVLRDKKASTSHVQRRLQIGYNRAANLIDRMEQDGLISPADHVGRRKIIAGSGGSEDEED